MIRILACSILFAVLIGPASSQIPGIGPKAPAKRLFGGFLFTEGPAQDANGNLFFSDVRLNNLYKVDTAGKLSTFLTKTKSANGIFFSRTGRMFSARGDGGDVIEIDPRTRKITVVAGKFGGKRFNGPNDLVIDVHGGIWFTDPNFRSNSQNKTAVYYIDAGGTTTRVIDTLSRPNGILLSPREDVLYVASTTPSAMMAYPVTAPGKVGAGRQLFGLAGRPVDGLTVDTLGNLYITRPASRAIEVITPRGKSLGRFTLPESPTNCAFGGPNMQTLYVTTRASVFRADMLSTGHRPMRLTSDVRTLRITGGRAKFAFVSTPFDKTRPYLMLASATGTAPGFVVEGTRIPLQPDLFTDLSIALLNTPLFNATLGRLDASGAGRASFVLPPVGAGLVGQRFRFSTLRLLPVDGASNAVEVALTR